MTLFNFSWNFQFAQSVGCQFRRPEHFTLVVKPISQFYSFDLAQTAPISSEYDGPSLNWSSVTPKNSQAQRKLVRETKPKSCLSVYVATSNSTNMSGYCINQGYLAQLAIAYHEYKLLIQIRLSEQRWRSSRFKVVRVQSEDSLSFIDHIHPLDCDHFDVEMITPQPKTRRDLHTTHRSPIRDGKPSCVMHIPQTMDLPTLITNRHVINVCLFFLVSNLVEGEITTCDP